VEVLTGTPRRRRWTDEEKAAIVAESQAPGAQASEIALRYGLHRNQLYGWRRDFGSAVANAMAEAGTQGPDFVPVVADCGSGAAAIEIEIGCAIVRVRAGVELGLLGKVLRLLKAMK
jgi:transposase